MGVLMFWPVDDPIPPGWVEVACRPDHHSFYSKTIKLVDPERDKSGANLIGLLTSPETHT